ncbi:MAG: hypothetical protein NTU84_09300, partial [Verrucomicrobia bacterium]|nr:hypothetical protein [Verrucomicrobiota bacterium]
VSSSIKDERAIPKDEVLLVRRSTVVNNDFAKISKLVPAPDLLNRREYERRMGLVEKFLKIKPEPEESNQAREMLATLKSEANEVLNGALKINGKMVGADDYRQDAYDMDARVAEIRIRRTVEAGAYIEALRAYEIFERDFSNSEVHHNLAPLMRQVVRAHVSELDEMLSTLDARIRERDIGLQRMSAIARRDAELAIADEASQLEAINKAEKDAKAAWLTVDPFLRKSIEEGLSHARKEEAKFAPVAALKAADGGRIFRDALLLVRSADKNSPSVAAAIEMVKAAMLPERYIALLQAEADAKPEPQKTEADPEPQNPEAEKPEPQKPEPQKPEPTKAVTETAK